MSNFNSVNSKMLQDRFVLNSSVKRIHRCR